VLLKTLIYASIGVIIGLAVYIVYQIAQLLG